MVRTACSSCTPPAQASKGQRCLHKSLQWPYTGKRSHKSKQKPAALGTALGVPSGLSSIPDLKDAEGGAPVTQGDHLGALSPSTKTEEMSITQKPLGLEFLDRLIINDFYNLKF